MDTNSIALQYPFLQGGGEMGELTRTYNWATSPLGTPDQWPQSLRSTISIILNSRFPMFLFWGTEHLCFYNDAYRPSLGNEGKHPQALGKPGAQVWPETWSFIKPLIDQVLVHQMATWHEDQLLPIFRNGKVEDVYWTFSYSPVYDESGRPAGVFVTCTETTQKIQTLRQLQVSDQRFQNLLREASIGIIVLTGPTMRVDMVNVAYARLINRQPDELQGNDLFSVIPEAEAVFRPIIESVGSTGEPVYLYGQPYFVFSKDGNKKGFLNLVYQPYKESDGAVTGVMVLCQDVTEQVKSRQQIEETEALLQEAVELAELGTWQFDLTTGWIDYSPRLRSWHGLELNEPITRERAYRLVRPADWETVRAGMRNAIAAGGRGVFDVEYRVMADASGQERILHSQGRVHVNEQGQPIKVHGTVQDVTLSRQVQLVLEQQVQQRTEDLEATNEELNATIEELAATNEELEEANRLLSLSNDNLEQFAYIASHDLQEPLRKVQQFGDLLKNEYSDQLGAGIKYLDRMQTAAGRMSALIKDLLSFARISANRNIDVPVDLTKVIQQVLSDLDLRIQEARAVITIAPLPIIEGDESQLTQLFLNLLSNAIKFRRLEVTPHISINYKRVMSRELPDTVKPNRVASLYHCVDVTDNGIGFDDKYLDRIFQVFQRLHSKNSYPGSGIGLAICEKVATNHGGAITALSEPGQGTTFSVYFPL